MLRKEEENKIINPKDILGDDVIENLSPAGDELNPDIKPTQPKKIELNTELQPPETIAFFKRLENGNNALIDYEADNTIIASYGNIENVVRKILVPKFGYGEYIPAKIEYDKKTKQKQYIYGKSIMVLEPNKKLDYDRQDNTTQSLLQTMMELLKREDEKERQRKEEFDTLIKSININKNSNDNRSNDIIAMVMQQQNNQMLMMMKMFENMKGDNDIKNSLMPIVSKIEELENKISYNNNFDNISEIKNSNRERDIIELISAIKNMFTPATQEEKNNINELLKEISNLKEKITQSQFDALKKEIEYLKSRETSSDDLEEFITKFQQIKKMSNLIDGKSDGFTDILGSLVEQLPDVIDKITKATPSIDPNKISQLEEENKKLKMALIQYNNYIKSLNNAKNSRALKQGQVLSMRTEKDKVQNGQQNIEKAKIDNTVKKERTITDKNKKKKVENEKIKVETDNTKKKNEKVINEKSKTDESVEKKKKFNEKILNKYISKELLDKLSNSNTDEDIMNSINEIVSNLMSNNLIGNAFYDIIKTAYSNGLESFRNTILKYLELLKGRISNYNLVVDCFNRNCSDWYSSLVLV